jgi:queuine tRNA-ribosyltransferase
MNWDKGIFTDSGGFQILSKDFLIQKSDKGVKFKDPYSGNKSLFTPEDSIRVQNDLDSDVAMAFDDVPNYGKSRNDVVDSAKRTFEWARRCKTAHQNEKQLLFGIAQGGTFSDLREKSAEQINSLDFDGYALGGLCIGEPKEKMYPAIESQIKIFDIEKPKYLMGVGSPVDILKSIQMGVDCFDSIFPTQSARRGSLFSPNGTIKIESGKYREDNSPIIEGCKCYTCRNFTKAYVHHQLFVHETFGLKLASIHNIHFVQDVMNEARKRIKEGTFDKFVVEFEKNYSAKNS